MSESRALHNGQYWEQFAVQPSDLDHLVNFLVESEKPHTIDELAYELTRYRHEKVQELVEDTLSQGKMYRPEDVYEEGDVLIFPQMGNLTGVVVEVRPGSNPEYEPFRVIQVETENDQVREFVSEFGHGHPLNTASFLPEEDINVDDLYERYGDRIESALRETLPGNEQFVNVAHLWFVRGLLVDISEVQLNIAEALLDMESGGPLRSEAFLEEMELPSEVSRSLQLFSLEYALLRDKRFDEVGPSGHALWYLRSMEPKEVLETPEKLKYMPVPYDRGLLDDVMLALEEQASDEWSDLEPDSSIADDEEVTVVLSYPHLRSGTLPLAPNVEVLFPTAQIADRIRFTFVDADTGEKFPGWVVRSGRYIYGLDAWYEEKDVIVGSYIDLAQSEAPDEFLIGVRPIRSQRREWLRTVTIEQSHLVFEVTRVLVSAEYDELAAVVVPEPESIDALSGQFDNTSLADLIDQGFSGLAGLSLQRAVHALTLYSVLNLMRRVPPGPMLATLAKLEKYESLGDNYWAYRGEE
jgi:hypothetical protein